MSGQFIGIVIDYCLHSFVKTIIHIQQKPLTHCIDTIDVITDHKSAIAYCNWFVNSFCIFSFGDHKGCVARNRMKNHLIIPKGVTSRANTDHSIGAIWNQALTSIATYLANRIVILIYENYNIYTYNIQSSHKSSSGSSYATFSPIFGGLPSGADDWSS